MKLPMHVFMAVALVVTAFIAFTMSSDWEKFFKPGILCALHGGNPYTEVQNFMNPPWIIVVLAPFALLPSPFDRIALFLVALYIYIRVTNYYEHKQQATLSGNTDIAGSGPG